MAQKTTTPNTAAAQAFLETLGRGQPIHLNHASAVGDDSTILLWDGEKWAAARAFLESLGRGQPVQLG